MTCDLRDCVIVHHGVKGQKWGVRRSLGPSGHIVGSKYATDSSKSKSSGSEKDGSPLLAMGLALSVGLSAPAAYQVLRSPASGRIKTQQLGQAYMSTVLGLTGFGAVNVATTIASQANKVVKTSAETFTREKMDIKMKTSLESPESDAKKINPKVNAWSEGTLNNCANATLAYEMRRRGYDVTAKPLYGGRLRDDTYSQYKNAEITTKERTSVFSNFTKEAKTQMFNDLAKHPNGSRGAVQVSFTKPGAGHIFNWEKTNGVVKLIDAQDYGSKPEKIFNRDMLKSVSYFRTDNLQLDLDLVHNSVKNYEEGK